MVGGDVWILKRAFLLDFRFALGQGRVFDDFGLVLQSLLGKHAAIVYREVQGVAEFNGQLVAGNFL